MAGNNTMAGIPVRFNPSKYIIAKTNNNPYWLKYPTISCDVMMSPPSC